MAKSNSAGKKPMGSGMQQTTLVARRSVVSLSNGSPKSATSWDSVARSDSMAAITPLRSLDMLDQLKQEAPLYRAAAGSAGAFDKSSVADYTDAMLTWWRTNGGSFPAWALAARIVFASSPNSASCERVFALLRNLFGELQMSSLADYVQAALMLNYNQRSVG